MRILSYNVSWEAMTNSSYGSAGNLGRKCTNNICMDNITNYINAVNKNKNKKGLLDFIALQEITLFDLFSSKITDFKSNYYYIESVSGPENLITCFLKKYVLIEKYCSSFRPGKGRPFHILYFHVGGEKIIFINLHYCNRFDICNLQRALTKGIKSMSKIKDLDKCRVIVAGDFNFNRWKYSPESFQVKYNETKKQIRFKPFKHSELETGCSLPKKTCCSDDDKDGKQMYSIGDFILDSKDKNNENKIYLENKIKGLTSDHYPIFSKLKL